MFYFTQRFLEREQPVRLDQDASDHWNLSLNLAEFLSPFRSRDSCREGCLDTNLSEVSGKRILKPKLSMGFTEHWY